MAKAQEFKDEHGKAKQQMLDSKNVVQQRKGNSLRIIRLEHEIPELTAKFRTLCEEVDSQGQDSQP